jgi:Domain of unknown function (DUF4307)
VTEPDLLDERYGRRRRAPRRARVLAVLGVLVLVLLTVAAFVWSRWGRTDVTWTVIGYSVESDSLTWVDFQVDKPDGTAVSCRVIAEDRFFDVVGSSDVPVPAAGAHVRQTVTLRTLGRAVTGTVKSCTVSPG